MGQKESLNMAGKTKFVLVQSVPDEVDRNTVRLCGNNTLSYSYPNGDKAWSLHGTEVIRISKNGQTVTLNSGGWKTSTTKDRINSFLPSGVSLYQNKGQWFVSHNGETVSFFDGMKIRLGKSLPQNKRVEKRDNSLQKQIDAYCKVLRKKIDEGFNFREMSGDCWYCLMTTDKGEGLGEAFGDKDHLLSHLKEKYIMGSLTVRALEASGYRREGIGLFLTDPKNFKDIIVRGVKKYFRGQLGLVGGGLRKVVEV